MTADPIAAKAEALWAKRPELRPLGLKYALSPVSKEMEWWLDDYGITDDDAHMLIEAACWRALPWAYHREFVDIDGTLKTYVIERPQRFDEGKMIAQAPSLTEALIAACMEAGQ